jgi:hypothetical protein
MAGNTNILRVTNKARAGMMPSKLARTDMMTPDGDRIVGEIITAMLKEGRRAEVDEIIVPMKVRQRDDKALGPDLARFMPEVDSMCCKELATHRRS